MYGVRCSALKSTYLAVGSHSVGRSRIQGAGELLVLVVKDYGNFLLLTQQMAESTQSQYPDNHLGVIREVITKVIKGVIREMIRKVIGR